MATITKVEMYLVDPNGDYGVNSEDIKSELEAILQRSDFSVKCLEINTAEPFEWDDDLAINMRKCNKKDCEAYFTTGVEAVVGSIKRKTERIQGIAVSTERYEKHSPCHYCEKQGTKDCTSAYCTYASILDSLCKVEEMLEEQNKEYKVYTEGTSGDDWNDGYFKCVHDLMELLGLKE